MLKDTGERMMLNDNWNLKTKLEHLHRYTIVGKYVDGKDVLDAACGTGYGSSILSEKAKSVTGIDLSKDAIDYCRENFHSDNLRYDCMSITDLKYPDNSFDVVVSFETFEHVSEEQEIRFLDEVKRVLKEDGILFISVPNDELLRRVTYGKYENEYHLVDFTKEKFENALKKYFDNISYYYQTVSLASSIISENEEINGEIIYDQKAIDTENERFYLAVCSSDSSITNLNLQSVYRPDLKQYYDEHYYQKESYIYLDTGNGYDGKRFCRAICHSYDGSSFKYMFNVNDSIDVVGVRFDPLEHAGEYQITKCTVNGQEKTITACNSVERKGYIDVFDDMDPQYIIEINEKYHSMDICIEGRVIDVIPDYIIWNKAKFNITEKQKQIENQKEEIENQKRALDNYQKELVNREQEILIYENRIKDYNEKIESLNAYYDSELKTIKKELAEKENIGELFKQIEMVCNTNIEVVGNILHTVNDLQYISQQTRWYKKAMKKIDSYNRTTKDAFVIRFYRFMHRGRIRIRLFDYMKKTLGVICPKKKHELAYKVWQDKMGVVEKDICEHNWIECIEEPKTINKPLVSVIVPNYNHAPYLRDRLESIYNQTYRNFEVILLDDCSTDDSRKILSEYADMYKDITRVCFNDTNVGRVNLQWNKGLSMANGNYIWIAESDDWCELDFLEKLVPEMEYQSVMIAFARSVFITDGVKTWSTEEYLYDTDMDWTKSFKMTTYEAIQKGFAKKNIIPNVSSAIFRKISEVPQEVMSIWENIKLCGDWIFYLYMLKGGTFSYVTNTTNYYRIHKKSTSLQVQQTEAYYEEQEVVSKYIARNFKVDKQVFEDVLKNLKAHYENVNPRGDSSDVEKWYRISEIVKEMKKRIPNILICNFAMKIGGGEILPIHLANALRKKGVSITFLDCNMESYDEKVRKMLDLNVPFVALRTPAAIDAAVNKYGIEVIHSHHASVDKLIAQYVMNINVKRVITLHGMYEAIEKKEQEDLLKHVCATCSKFAYIADKNLVPFIEYGYYEQEKFEKVYNGLMIENVVPYDREKLGISKEDFVLCLVSRARFDKGWMEAIEAVKIANKCCDRNIHLILVGDGEAYEKAKKEESNIIHVMGMQPNPRSFFAAADLGFLPSRFAGESVPLVVIESLMCNKPILASNVGEISNMITASNNASAGILFELENGKINVDSLARIIKDIAIDQVKYDELINNIPKVVEKFDIMNVADKYITLYEKCERNV